jgi:hypothetical protein
MGEKKTIFGYFLASTKKLPAGRRTAEAFDLPRSRKQRRWIPSFAGMMIKRRSWIPVFTGMTLKRKSWIPASAGMTSEKRAISTANAISFLKP